MNTSLKPWVQYWIYSWLGVPKTAVGGWKCCQRTSGLLRTKHKPEKYRAYAAQVQFLPMPFSVSMWGFLQPQGTPSYHSRQMGLVVPHFRYIWNLPGRAYTFGQSTCETFRQLQLHPGPCQVTDLIAKEFSFMAVEQMCHGWSPLRGPQLGGRRLKIKMMKIG